MPPSSLYDIAVLGDNPVHYMTPEISGGSSPAIGFAEMPNCDVAWWFPVGQKRYIEYASVPTMSVPSTGVLTIEAWMRPDVNVFQHEEGTGYVHWLGKGVSGKQEYTARMYGLGNSEGRDNRISGYCFNAVGGQGVGSYFQDTVTPFEWIHYTLTINTVDTSVAYPMGYTRIFKNGVMRDTDSLSALNIVPTANNAPFRIGTRDFASFFEGAIGKVALYNYELTTTQLAAHYTTMTQGGC